ncbi:hypothetical protein [Edaphobacter bradus]|uniref:hypothetical protein n=1 Tax=Edaphobacter bradus TaxID=2259016 RepID=UPI0021E01C11|nr:hypothetical protein [Edaphobacter bradus]
MKMRGIAHMALLVCITFMPLHPLLAYQALSKEDTSILTPCVAVEANWFLMRTGAPFIASWKETRVFTRSADGASVTKVITGKEARDSSGKVYIETHGWVGLTNKLAHVEFTVLDPQKYIGVEWMENLNPALLFHFSKWVALRKEWNSAPWVPNADACKAVGATWGLRVQKLGTKTILGIDTEGIHATGTIPATTTNGLIRVTQERWYSTALGITLFNSFDEPGKSSTWEITEFQPAEPDPQLFLIPEGYTIKNLCPDECDIGLSGH